MAESNVKHGEEWKLETVRTSVGVCHKIGPLGSSTQIKFACLYDDCHAAVPRDIQLFEDALLIAAAPETKRQRDELLEALKDCAELLNLAAERLGVCGEGDGKDRRADAELPGVGAALLSAMTAINHAEGRS